MRLATEDKDETLVVRGMLSIEDCEDAVKMKSKLCVKHELNFS